MKFVLSCLLTLLAATGVANAQSTFTAQIHNACGWQASHTYTYAAGPPSGHFARVNNGPAWSPAGTGTCTATTTPDGTYTSGLGLNSYQLRDPGGGHTCVSAASGGPTTTSSGITDGTCTWNYVGAVDYVSFTGWTLDNGTVWTTGTDYGFDQILQTSDPGNPVYEQTTAGCTSTVKPTGLTDPGLQSDGCYWLYVGNVTYSSYSHPFPSPYFYFDHIVGSITGNQLTVTTPPVSIPLIAGQCLNYIGTPEVHNATAAAPCVTIVSGSGATWTLSESVSNYTGPIFFAAMASVAAGPHSCCYVASNDLYIASLWNDREYITGANGEPFLLTMCCHNWQNNDGFTNMYALSPADTTQSQYGFPIQITAAPGESFLDTYAANPSLPLTGYNANYGVGLRQPTPYAPVMYADDNVLIISRLQMKGDGSPTSLHGGKGCNNCNYSHNILEGTGIAGYAYSVTDSGAAGSYYDNLIVAHGNTTGIGADYGSRVYYNTVVCPDGPACAASGIDNTWDFGNLHGMQLINNAVFGFAHFISILDHVNTVPCLGSFCATWEGTNNITDVVSTDGNDYPNTVISPGGSGFRYVLNFATGQPYCAYWTPGFSSLVPSTCGVTTSISPSSAFVAWPTNFKISPSSPLYGGGAFVGSFNFINEWDTANCTFIGCVLTDVDVPDVFGISRPVGGRYDIGAFQYPSGGGASFGGRFLFR